MLYRLQCREKHVRAMTLTTISPVYYNSSSNSSNNSYDYKSGFCGLRLNSDGLRSG